MGGSQGPNLECGEECLVSGRRTLNGYGATVLRDGKDFGAWCWWWTSRWAVAAKMLKDGPKGSGKKKRVMIIAFRIGGRRYSRDGGVASGAVNSHGRVRRLPFKRIGEAQNPGPAVHKAVVASYNGNCWTRTRRFLNDTKARIVFVQEHKRCRGDTYNSMSAQALRDGWKCCGTHGLKSDLEMPVAGTAVMVRKHIGVKAIPLPEVDGYTIVDGRAAGVMVDYWLTGMVLCSSLYLKVGVGMNDDNWDTLKAVGAIIAKLGIPFIIGGDFNEEQ